MSQNPITAIATVGIDIGKTHSTWLALDQPRRDACCDRSGRVARWTHDLPPCRRAWSDGRLVSVRTTSAGSLRRIGH